MAVVEPSAGVGVVEEAAGVTPGGAGADEVGAAALLELEDLAFFDI